MQRFLTRRFEVIRVLRRSKDVNSFVGHDRWTERREVFVKCITSRACRISGGFEEPLAWHRGVVHPLIGNIHEAGFTPRKDFYYVRTYYPGESTKSLKTTVAPTTIAKHLVAAFSLLQAHSIVHGRIKPSNVLMQNSRKLRLIDGGLPGLPLELFGLEDIRSSAPEILTGEQASLESDLYSLGTLLYLLFTGRNLVEDSNPEFLKQKYRHASPVPLSKFCDSPRGISEIVSRLLDRNPASRSAAFPALKDLLCVRTSAPRQACFIGRWTELREAARVLDTKVEKVRVLTIEGETGIGKTRFVDELAFRRQLQADRFLRGRCYERENRQYEPILQVIGDRLKWRDQELEA